MIDAQEKTAAEAGLTTERQIQIALQEMETRGSEVTSNQLYEVIERYMPAGASLSQQGRDTLRALISREAVDKGYVEPYDPARPGWRITPKGRVYLADVRREVGVEEEELVSDEQATALEDVAIRRPFDTTSIRVDQRMMPVFQMMRKIELEEINLDPDFQRHLVWDATRKSRLIESILLRIPLPAFYLDATLDDRWLIVDGLQRLTTLHEFFNLKSLKLTNLEYLADLEGKLFGKLPRAHQRTFEETDLNLYIIRPDTPPDVKFTIFSRVNTGGMVLTPQEIRHALFQGHATVFLKQLAELPEFRQATTGSISTLRMDDRECALRFLAFYLNDYKTYGKTELRDHRGRVLPSNLDGFLSWMMDRLNHTSAEERDRLGKLFAHAMINAATVFGEYTFRKMYQRGGRRTQISKPLFEVWSVLLQPYATEALVLHREAIVDGFIELMQDVEFNKAISLGTGSVRAVITRFSRVEQLLTRVMA